MIRSDTVHRSWSDVAELLDGDPLGWLPTPVHAAPPARYRGLVKLLGRDVDVAYVIDVDVPVAAGGYRRLGVMPDPAWLAGFESELSLLPDESDPTVTEVMLMGAPTANRLASLPFGWISRRLLFARVHERIVRRLAMETSS